MKNYSLREKAFVDINYLFTIEEKVCIKKLKWLDSIGCIAVDVSGVYKIWLVRHIVYMYICMEYFFVSNSFF